MRDIPQEVIDHIFDYFRDDKPTLAALGLVCWSWNQSSRVHFFHSVDFAVPLSSYTRPLKTRADHAGQLVFLKKYERLVAIINRKPVVASLIREVRVTYDSELGSSRWRVSELIFTCILGMLERVHTLRLCQIQWTQLGASFRKALTRIYSSPNLLQLELYNCYFSRTKDLTRVIGYSPGLKVLTLAFIRVEGLSFLLEERALHGEALSTHCLSSSRRAPLKKLVVETTMIVAWLSFLQDPVLCPLDVSSVNELYLSQVDDVQATNQYIQATGSNLESLEMWAPSSPEVLTCTQGTIDLSYTPKLRRLQIYGLPWSVNLCPGGCVTKMLENISTLHPLEEVFVLTNIVKKQSEGLDWIKWRALDECLARPVFHSLKKFEVVITLASSGPKCIDLEEFKNQFPALNARRLLTVRRQ
ncbi:hypothetical protein BDQ17DRAFT_1354065 [Cyathus striatus]|nr:hypothetical protein BDQ17DRAFT_1354065 [Cyathus striatus]